MNSNFQNIVEIIRARYGEGFIPLHAPYFGGNEKKYLNDCIDSTFVSSVGEYVNQFEQQLTEITGAKFAIATVNGTAALHMSLILADIQPGDEVITQALTFVATANAISYCGARPIFIDVDRSTMSLSVEKLEHFLLHETEQSLDGFCLNKTTKKKIRACIPMHTFGMVGHIQGIVELCKNHNIIVIEDTAESLGSFIGNQHTGNFGQTAAFSFNGNKTVTCGGGGAIITNDEEIAKKAKHLTTTAKVAHPWEFFHDEIGYNYRMPNLNAALACAQLEQLSDFLVNKRETALYYKDAFSKIGVEMMFERDGTTANNWLNAIVLENKNARDEFLQFSKDHNIMTRPVWTLMNKLPAFKGCQTDGLTQSNWLEDRIVNIPSSFIPK